MKSSQRADVRRANNARPAAQPASSLPLVKGLKACSVWAWTFSDIFCCCAMGVGYLFESRLNSCLCICMVQSFDYEYPDRGMHVRASLIILIISF